MLLSATANRQTARQPKASQQRPAATASGNHMLPCLLPRWERFHPYRQRLLAPARHPEQRENRPLGKRHCQIPVAHPHLMRKGIEAQQMGNLSILRTDPFDCLGGNNGWRGSRQGDCFCCARLFTPQPRLPVTLEGDTQQLLRPSGQGRIGWAKLGDGGWHDCWWYFHTTA